MKKLSARKKKWIERTVANDRSFKGFLYNRFFVFLFSVLLQLVFFALFAVAIVYRSRFAIVAQLVIFIAEIIFVLYIINKNNRPSTKMSWILLIVLFPAFGVPMYLLNGGGRPTKRMRKKIEKAYEENEKQMLAYYGEREMPNVENRSDAITGYLFKYGGYPTFYDGDIRYYKSGEEMFPYMLDDLQSAEKFILVEYFIIAHGKMWDAILKILLEKAMQGVKIRILYDDFGCMVTLPPKYERYLESLHENIQCMTFNDVVPFFAVRMNNRDHRKILVIDGKVAYTGGINLADEYIAEKRRFGYWKDTGVRITGDAVSSFTKMFFYLWNAFRKDKEDISGYLLPYEDKQTDEMATDFRLLPYDDSPLDGLQTGEAVYVDIINRAKKYVWICTPYLVLDDYMRAAICEAAARGVDVRIITPGIPDKKITYRLTRANYGILMKSGVKIYEYTPGFIHAKSMVSDDECAVVGTINLDYRSLYHHFENAVYFAGCTAVSDVKRDVEETFAVSKLCTAENTKRGFFGRIFDSVIRVFETLM